MVKVTKYTYEKQYHSVEGERTACFSLKLKFQYFLWENIS